MDPVQQFIAVKQRFNDLKPFVWAGSVPVSAYVAVLRVCVSDAVCSALCAVRPSSACPLPWSRNAVLCAVLCAVFVSVCHRYQDALTRCTSELAAGGGGEAGEVAPITLAVGAGAEASVEAAAGAGSSADDSSSHATTILTPEMEARLCEVDAVNRTRASMGLTVNEARATVSVKDTIVPIHPVGSLNLDLFSSAFKGGGKGGAEKGACPGEWVVLGVDAVFFHWGVSVGCAVGFSAVGAVHGAPLSDARCCVLSEN
jgi:hypothetical protein